MTKKLKILHTMTWLAKGGGVDHNVFLTINGLKDEYDFHLATGSEIHHNPFLEIEGIKFIVCKDLVRPIRPLRDLKALFFFTRLIRKEKYDIVHTHEAKASLVTRLAAYLAGCRYIVYGLHGVTFNDPLSRFKRKLYILMERLTVGVSDLIVGVSEDVINHYHNENIGKKIPYRVIHSGIDIDKFSKDALTDPEKIVSLKKSMGIVIGDVVLINVGRFSFSKGQRYTIQSFAALKKIHPNLKLILTGDGELTDECKQLAKELNLEKDIIFYGFSDKIAALLSVSDIHVLTSLREGLPRVAVEASLMKVPTVAFEVEGIREVIADLETGFIVASGDLTSLTEKINLLIKDNQKRKNFGEQAYVRVRKKWDAKEMIQQLRTVYESCKSR